MKFSIRLLYLYLFSFIGLSVSIVGGIRLIQLGLKVFVFNGADQYAAYLVPPIPVPNEKEDRLLKSDLENQKLINEEETKRQRAREVAEGAAMIIVGLPLYLYHWKTIQKESKKHKS